MNQPLGRIRLASAPILQSVAPAARPCPSRPAIRYACESLETRRLLAEVTGIVYHDVNANGRKDLSEALQEGFQIYADLNKNGALDQGEPATLSGKFGEWRISGLAAGNYQIRQVERQGFARKPQQPAAGFYNVGLGAEEVRTGLDFGNSRYAGAKGQVFFDVNGDGKFNGADTPQADVRVFVDYNGNGTRDAGELSKLTNANGEYRIDFIYPGVHNVRVEPPTGQRFSTRNNYRVLFFSNRRSENLNFGLTNTGTISGHLWSDLNGDAAQSPDEPDLNNRLVFLDQNQNAVRDNGEVGVLTDAQGNYTFVDLKPGGYIVRADRPSGTETTVPETGERYEVQLNASQNVTALNFAFAPLGKIRGTVFGDINSDGVFDGELGFGAEEGIRGQRVYLDLNGDGILQRATEPLFFTNSRGEYEFSNLKTGTYIVRLILGPNEVQTFPSSGGQLVDVRAGQVEKDNNFGVAVAGQITGRLFSDRNGNGTFDAEENGLRNRRVFIDANGDGDFDAGEPSTVSDANGNYRLTGLRAGSYVVRTTPVPGAIQTVPPSGAHTVIVQVGSVATNRNFGFAQPGGLTGTVFADLNANGVQDGAEAGVAGATVFLDRNNNGTFDIGETTAVTNAAGVYSFTGVRPGTYGVRLQLTGPLAGQTISVPATGFYTAQVLGAQTRSGFTFGVYTPATITGIVFADLNANGVQDLGETGLTGRVVFIDANANGVLDAGEVQDTTDINGAYVITGLPPGSYRVTVAASGNELVTAPVAGFYNATVTTAQTLPGQNFGLSSGTITGTVFEDVDADGIRDIGEPGVSGVTLFIDENNNNTPDAGEVTATTDATGAYTFTDLPAGTYVVRVEPAAGQTVTSPVAGERAVTITTGQTSPNNDFGLDAGAAITGTVFDDNDADGAFTPGDLLLAGRQVYIDADNDDTFDPTERSAVTDLTGNYRLGGVPNGTFNVRVVINPGEAILDPITGEYSITIAGGADDAGNDFALNVP